MDMKKMMENMKKGEERSSMSKDEIKAKIDVLQELMDMADGAEGDSIIDGLQKITIAAPDKEGLEEGLDKAEEIMEDMPQPEMDEESDEEELDLDEESDEEDEEEDEKDKKGY